MFEIRPYYRNNNYVYADPFREIEKFFFGTAPETCDKSRAFHGFRTDLRDNGDSYVLEADLPGFDKSDIEINIEGDVLTIKAERHSEHEEEDKKGKYIRCERSYGSYSRKFDVSEIACDNIKAKYENGVLSLDMPKKTPEAPAARRLEIE